MASDDARQIRIGLDERPQGIVATVTICNARRLNTMNSVLMREFIEQMAVLAASRELRALVLTGEGEKAFIGGADIKEMGLIRDAAGARAFISQAHACCISQTLASAPAAVRLQKALIRSWEDLPLRAAIAAGIDAFAAAYDTDEPRSRMH